MTPDVKSSDANPLHNAAASIIRRQTGTSVRLLVSQYHCKVDNCGRHLLKAEKCDRQSVSDGEQM